MKRQSIRFNDNLNKLIEELVEQKLVKSFQDFIDKSVENYLRKLGIREIIKLPQYELKSNCTRTYTKSETKTAPKVTPKITKQPLPQKELTTRERIRIANDSMPKDKDPELYEEWEELEKALLKLADPRSETQTERGWTNAFRIAEKNEDKFEEELGKFFESYDNRITK